MRSTFLSALAFAGATLLVAPLSHAQSSPEADPAAEARRQYNLGTQSFAAHKFPEAAKAFEAAAAFKAHAVTLYTAALAWEQADQPERAADDFGRALDVPGLSPEQTKAAREKLDALEKSLGTVVVKGPDGARAQLDAFTEVAMPARLHGRAGLHTLTTTLPGAEPVRREVKLQEAKTTDVEIEAAPKPVEAPPPVVEKPKPAPPPPPPKSEEPQESSGVRLRRSLGLVAIGVGAATLAAGAVLGIEALDAKDAFDSSPTRATYDHASGLQTWTNVALVAGGVFAVGGVVLFVWPSGGHGQVTVGATPGGGYLRGAF